VHKTGPMVLGGVELPADTTLYLTAWPLQRSRRHWGEDADRFDPGRWARRRKAHDPFGSGHFFPFGRGPRSCAGQGLGLIDTKLILAAIFSQAGVEIAPEQRYDMTHYFGVLLPEEMKGRIVLAGRARTP